MGKKRKASRQASEPKGPRDVDAADARLLVNSYEDVADSEDEFFINRDKILLEGEPRAKRLKSQKEDEMFESSDEEVLGYDNDDDSGEDEDDDDKPAKRKGSNNDSEDEEDGDGGEEEEEDLGYWGSSKKEYYDADALETEADALEEEAEARRLQQKKLSRMSEADFMFDADEWAAQGDDEAQDGGDGAAVVTEVLKEVEITDDMSPEEVYRILQARYPEFDLLVDEFLELRPLLAIYQKEAEGKPAKSLEVVRYWILGCHVAALASYFAILTSPARDGRGSQQQHGKTLDPATLRDHEVMETLVSSREAWLRVRDLKPSAKARARAAAVSPSGDNEVLHTSSTGASGKTKKAKAVKAQEASKTKKSKSLDKQQLAKSKKLEESLADLSDLLAQPKKSKKSKKQPNAHEVEEEGDNSDFGEEDALDSRTAEDKAARKKTLRFYTSQIVQKATRRAGAGRDAGGDMDIPHRERLRDRQARLNAEAERRGQKALKPGEELDGGDDSGDDAALAEEIRGGEDEYYDMVAHASRQKKADKAARNEALKAAGKLGRVVEVEEVGEDGKRQITYAIMKNKGLAPKRKKDVRNPRVKKRKKFAEKQKKLKSIRAVYGGGEGRGGYQGELSGIKTGLIKSVKL